MRRAIIFALLLFFPTVLHARVIKWEGKPILVSISTERLTRIEFPEGLRSVFLSRPDIAVEKEDRSLYVRALESSGLRDQVGPAQAIDFTVKACIKIAV
jgi:hypothetical protein